MRHLSMLVVVAVFFMMTAPLFGGENADLRKQLGDVNKEISAARDKAVKENADVKKLNDAVTAAQKAVQKAYGDIPEVKAVDDKVAEARIEMGKLMKDRTDAIKKASEAEAVKTAKKAVTAAQEALKKDPGNDAIDNDGDGAIDEADEKLLNGQKNADLQKALKDAQAALLKAVSEVPEVKAVDEKMAEPKKKMEDLNKEREGLRKKNAENEAVKAALQVQVDAKAALDKAVAELPGMKELADKKADLEKQLKPAPKPKAEAPKAPRVPRPAGNGVGGQM